MNSTRTPSLLAKTLRAGLAGLGLVAAGGGLATGCLDRPVSPAVPATTNVVVEKIAQEKVDKIDLLFSIDNSISMADKQAILALAVPQLVKRLVQPICVNEDGAPTGGNFPCAAPSKEEFAPVLDIHVGIVTSSLGSHGGNVCPTIDNPTNDDRGRLLGEVRAGLPQDGRGFLHWKPGNDQFGDAEVNAFADRFKQHVEASGESGCGFEAQLESWYRFLIDPEPPSRVIKEANTVAVRGPCGSPDADDVVCAQRAEFLRPDSLVAIIMLTDENDCSIRDSDVGWYVSDVGGPLAKATPVCDTNPNDPCCQSCATSPPAECGSCGTLDLNTTDRINLRCWDQKRRFGIDFLYPTMRYVNALKKASLCLDRPDLDPDQCAGGRTAPNPLFSDLTGLGVAAPRIAGSDGSPLVFIAGIVGVPWQDIATDDTLSDTVQDLKYLTAEQIAARNRWDWITGDSSRPPLDPLMIESRGPRSGTHPLDPKFNPQPPDSPQRANPINGHEWRPDDNPGLALNNGDLQYACMFDLQPTKNCATATGGCDCKGAGQAGYTQNNPLCQAGDGSYGTEQFFAKGYPGLRELQVLRDYGRNSIVASICPKIATGSASAPGYGYNPAVGAIIDRLKEVLGGKCLPRTIALDEAGNVPCKVLEALPTGGATCGCGDPGRCSINNASCVENGGKLRAAVEDELRKEGLCDRAGSVACKDWCVCLVQPYAGADKTACENEISFDATAGWCYIDPEDPPTGQNIGSKSLVTNCPASQKRLLRFEPKGGAIGLIACLGGVVTPQ
jgi:hypothetical protein